MQTVDERDPSALDLDQDLSLLTKEAIKKVEIKDMDLKLSQLQSKLKMCEKEIRDSEKELAALNEKPNVSGA